MTWVSILKALLQIALVVFGYVRERKLLDAGEAQEVARSLDAALNALGVVDKARSDAIAKFRDAGSVPDPTDPNLRD